MKEMPSVSIELRPLSGTAAEAEVVQRIFDAAPGYAALTTGAAERTGAASRTFELIPDGFTRDDKHMFLILADDHPVGFTDVIRGLPDTGSVYVGLFLLSESHHGAGIGRRAYAELETLIAGWRGIERIELSVVATNTPALGFWKAMGFAPTGERTPYEAGTVKSEHIFFDKRLR